MSKEDLLKPRLKVMLDYPDSDYEVGQIIEFNSKSAFYTGTMEWQTEWIKHKNGGGGMRCIKYFEPFPLIFKPMEWWEDRKLEDMPDFIRYGDMAVYRVRWDFSGNNLGYIAWAADREDYCLPLQSHVRPATLEEYNEYRLLNP